MAGYLKITLVAGHLSFVMPMSAGSKKLLSSLSLSGQLGVKAILRSGVSAGKAVLSKIGTVEKVRAAFWQRRPEVSSAGFLSFRPGMTAV